MPSTPEPLTTDIASPRHDDQTVPPVGSPEFLKVLQAWIKGEEKPQHPLSPPLLDDIKARVAERDALVEKLQEAEKGFRQSQAQHAHLSGRIDGLVESLHRLETHAAG